MMPGAEDRIQAAIAELDAVIGRAQEDLYRFQRANEPTREELQALQDAARRGELGDDMRELARRVESGQDSWRAIFAGESPNANLLRGHLERMAEENREAISTALAEDETFDPFAPSPDL
ncbi:hypothetical protein [Actinokineospora iranica]|uniref:Uncharacterized protein n=1 Tax=Actinokineospora iranica TaxID=1271860 RepID=A0A1G6J4I0_9PSEU|nr:hypothetical protein [Actinokineospora iranica]SDC13175.1 hypothetical protein SAMN05216174_101215 [Actinokineospora iranica]